MSNNNVIRAFASVFLDYNIPDDGTLSNVNPVVIPYDENGDAVHVRSQILKYRIVWFYYRANFR